jgi:hypothetical protein
LILSPVEKPFLRELRDIPIKDHNFPDSEITTGKREEKIIELSKRVLTDEMLDETFQSLLGYCTFSLNGTDFRSSKM